MGSCISSNSHASYTKTILVRDSSSSRELASFQPSQKYPLHRQLTNSSRKHFNSLRKLPSSKIIDIKSIYKNRNALCEKVSLDRRRETTNDNTKNSLTGSATNRKRRRPPSLEYESGLVKPSDAVRSKETTKSPVWEQQQVPLVSVCGSYTATRKKIVSHIKNAKESIRICFQALQDRRIWKALKRSAEKNGVKVELIFQWSDLVDLQSAAPEGSWETIYSSSQSSSAAAEDHVASPTPSNVSDYQINLMPNSTAMWIDTIIIPPASSALKHSRGGNSPASPSTRRPKSGAAASLETLHDNIPNSQQQQSAQKGSVRVKRLFWQNENADHSSFQCNFMLIDSKTVIVSSHYLDPVQWKTPLTSLVLEECEKVSYIYDQLFEKLNEHSLDQNAFFEYMRNEGSEHLQFNTPQMQIRFFPVKENQFWDPDYCLLARGMKRLEENLIAHKEPGTFAFYVNATHMESSTEWSTGFKAHLSALTREGVNLADTRSSGRFQCKGKFATPSELTASSDSQDSTAVRKKKRLFSLRKKAKSAQNSNPEIAASSPMLLPFHHVKNGCKTNCQNYSFEHRPLGECYSLFSTSPISGKSLGEQCSNQILMFEKFSREEYTRSKKRRSNSLLRLLPTTAAGQSGTIHGGDGDWNNLKKGSPTLWPIHRALMALFESV